MKNRCLKYQIRLEKWKMLSRFLICLSCFVNVAALAEHPIASIKDRRNDAPPRPWARAFEQNLPPGEPGKDYTPAVVPNGTKAKYKIIDGFKVFHLIAEPVACEVAKEFFVHLWGYNGSVPGPLIEVAEGDKVRIFVTNKLLAPTTVHWHGVRNICGMDGVPGLTQPVIQSGQTFLYEFIFPNSGTFMYHSHRDSMTQEGIGLNGMIIVHKREPELKKDRIATLPYCSKNGALMLELRDRIRSNRAISIS